MGLLWYLRFVRGCTSSRGRTSGHDDTAELCGSRGKGWMRSKRGKRASLGGLGSPALTNGHRESPCGEWWLHSTRFGCCFLMSLSLAGCNALTSDVQREGEWLFCLYWVPLPSAPFYIRRHAVPRAIKLLSVLRSFSSPNFTLERKNFFLSNSQWSKRSSVVCSTNATRTLQTYAW